MPSKKPSKFKKRSSLQINNQDLYRQLIEQTPDCIFVVNFSGHITYVNKAAARLLKASFKNIIGKHFGIFIDKDSMGKAMGHIEHVRKGHAVVAEELNVLDVKKNVIPIEFTASPTYSKGRIHQVHVIVRDVSRRKEYESLVRETDKMNALQHFISGTAQEIQHPLESLLSRIQSLIEKYKERDFEYIGYKEFKDIMETLEVMRDQAKYCFDTTNRLLSITKQSVGFNVDYCDVNDVLRESVRFVKHHLEVTDINVKFSLKLKLPPASIGNFELNEVLVKVLTNAIQAMPSGGEIHLKTSYQKEKQMLQVEIRDEGVGIPQENLQRVFDPFFTTKQRGLEKSSGLGLSIVYSIVKSFGGDVAIKSKSRQGTRMILRLPAYKKLHKG